MKISQKCQGTKNQEIWLYTSENMTPDDIRCMVSNSWDILCKKHKLDVFSLEEIKNTHTQT